MTSHLAGMFNLISHLYGAAQHRNCAQFESTRAPVRDEDASTLRMVWIQGVRG